VGYDPSRHRAHRDLPLESPLGRLLRVNLELLIEAMPTVETAEANSFADGFSGLLGTLLAHGATSEPQRAQFEEARERQVRRLIEEHLGDPDLGVARICRLAGVSRATLYRMMEPVGGVVGYVLARRLEAAMTDLSRSDPRRGIVAEVARRWAINDPSLFSRQFRARFGMRPSDVVGTKLLTASNELSDHGSGGLPTSVPPLSVLYR
ncbi:MAG: helix-turn-helix domain-containing protein, partial [Pseudomonadota bacterium]